MEFIKRNSDYALSALEYMGRFPMEKVFLLSDIAGNVRVSEVFLRKIFQKLGKHGIVVSQRGPRGGFSLAKNPDEITLREIIESVQGPIFFNQCGDGKGPCSRKKNCRLQRGMQILQTDFIKLMEKVTLKEMSLIK